MEAKMNKVLLELGKELNGLVYELVDLVLNSDTVGNSNELHDLALYDTAQTVKDIQTTLYTYKVKARQLQKAEPPEPEPDNKTFGETLKFLRKRGGWTQSDFAKELSMNTKGLAQSVISKMEKGALVPDLFQLSAIGNVLKLSETGEWEHFKSLWMKAKGPEVRLVVNKEHPDVD